MASATHSRRLSSRAVHQLAAGLLPLPGINLQPVPPGTGVTPVSVAAVGLQTLLIAALGAIYVAPEATPATEVVWYDHDSEVLVHLDQTLVKLTDGVVLVALTLEADQTGVGQLTVPLSIGSAEAPAGLLVVTESRARGPVALVDRWGEAAIAAAWRGLLDAAHAIALNAGFDTSGARLVPAALSTDGVTFTVLPQARYEIDAVAGR
jgi:hypothetical protein